MNEFYKPSKTLMKYSVQNSIMGLFLAAALLHLGACGGGASDENMPLAAEINDGNIIKFEANLDSRTEVLQVEFDPDSTNSYSASVSLIIQPDDKRRLTLYFRKHSTAIPDAWQVYAVIDKAIVSTVFIL